MASLLTNAAAMTALQTLSNTSKALDTTQNRISTGMRISTASDGAAYWSIATTMRSDNKSLSAVQDSLGLAAATVDVQYTALTSTVEQLTEIGKLLVSAKEPGVDLGKIQKEIKTRLDQIQSVASSSVFNSENWLAADPAAGTQKQLVGSFSRVGSAITIETVNYDIAGSLLYDTAAAGATGIMDKASIVGLVTTAASSDNSIAAIDISKLTAATEADRQGDLTKIITAVNTQLNGLTDAASNLGALKTRLDTQKDFVKSLTDAIDRGIGQLVDADMNAESTRLQALQTQQQLGIQALSIANSNSQNILSLFRG
ncbi:MAG: Flagellin-like protein [Proteobacteria bacterium]|nr:Flagellin-like protein [Pseudomonadota bacterium]